MYKKETLYLREDCGHEDPSMSPGSCSGREAGTLTPAPNGAKVFYVARRTRCIAETTESWPKEKYFFFREGDQTWFLSPEEPVFDPLAKGR